MIIEMIGGLPFIMPPSIFNTTFPYHPFRLLIFSATCYQPSTSIIKVNMNITWFNPWTWQWSLLLR